jgi:hypothetical protein
MEPNGSVPSSQALLLVFIPSQLTSVHTILFLKTYFNIILPSKPLTSTPGFPPEASHAFRISPMPAICYAHLLDVMILTIFGEEENNGLINYEIFSGFPLVPLSGSKY